MNRIARSVVGLCVLLGLVSCEGWWDGSGTRHLVWTEDVVLASGERVTVAREQDVFFQKSMADGVGTDRGRRSLVRSVLPDGSFPEWSAPLIPQVLDRDPASGRWFLIATMGWCETWNRNGEPLPPYWGFAVVDGRWVRAAIPDSLWGTRSNLLVSYDWDDSSRDVQSTLPQRKVSQAKRTDGKVFRIDPEVKAHCTRADRGDHGATELDLQAFQEIGGSVPAVPDAASAN